MSEASQPTWLSDIRSLFTQFDVVMMRSYFDLNSYDDVKKHAEIIWLSLQEDPKRPGWSLVPHVHRMPLGRKPWPAGDIALLKRWMDAGCPFGKALAEYKQDPDLDVFIKLSVELTGFDDRTRNPKVANALLLRLRSDPEASKALPALLDAVKKCADVPAIGQLIDAQTGAEASLIKVIALLWYTGAFYPKGSRFPSDFGTPEDNQYRDGLMWPAGYAHPFGYSVEQQYWQNTPEPNGRYTGLGVQK